MNINELIAIVKKKLEKDINVEKILVEDKTYLHKNHSGHEIDKFHLKIIVHSQKFKQMSKIESNKKIYKILADELKNHIHSLQILIR